MKTFLVRLSVFTTVMLFPYINSSYAGCGGSGKGGGPGYTPPSPSAAAAMDLLKGMPNALVPKTGTPPTAVMPAAPSVITTSTTTAAPAKAPPTPSATTPTPTVAGKVAWVKGTLKVVGADKKVRILQTGSPIYPEDTVVTDSHSQAQVVFSDHTLMTFDKSTVFNVTKYNYHPEVKSGSAGTFVGNLIVGTYRTVTGAIPKANHKDYQVNTEVAVMGVAGTDYSASFHSCHVDMKRTNGTPILTNDKGTITLTQSSPYASVNSASTPPVTIAVEPIPFRNPLPIVNVNFATIPTMPPLNSGGGGGNCGPGSGGGGFSVRFK